MQKPDVWTVEVLSVLKTLRTQHISSVVEPKDEKPQHISNKCAHSCLATSEICSNARILLMRAP